jgi:hypothetical protein
VAGTTQNSAGGPRRSAARSTSCAPTAAGSPAEIGERIGQYAATGVQTMYLQVMDLTDVDHLELLAEILRLT